MSKLLHASLVENAVGRYSGFGTLAAGVLRMLAQENGMALDQGKAEVAV